MTTPDRFRSLVSRALVALVVPALMAASAHAAVITIINNDGAGEGFNDPTPVAPVGGNPGVTVGAQRLFLFQYAANIWGSILPSAVQIDVRANFDSLTCTPTGAVLGSAGTTTVHANFPNADYTSIWYPQALANKLAGVDLSANPDLQARFNSRLDTGLPGCLAGTKWYYGIDGNEGTLVELLPVVLHEIAHGLGFATTTSGTTGNYLGTAPNQFPNIYDRYLYDGVTAQHWADPAMTAAQRVASAITVDQLQWDGYWATTAASSFLAPRKRMLVTAPGGIAGSYSANVASFGPQSYSVSGDVVVVDDGVAPGSDGCTALINGAQVAGRIALIDRGTCTFVAKAQAAQAAGAIAVIIANNTTGALLPGGTDPTIVIPVVGITQADGNTLKTALLSNTVTVTLDDDPVLKAGMHPSGRPLMYAPNPFQSGSSVSHWDVSMTPNTLMEPAINTNLHDAVDITTDLFRDIGWFPYVTATTLATFTAEGREDGVLLRWRFADPGDVRETVVERAATADGEWAAVPVTLGAEGSMMTALDPDAPADRASWYRLRYTDLTGHSYLAGMVSAQRAGGLAGRVALGRPAPNPSTDRTAVTFTLGRAEFVRLAVTDPSGRRVRTLQNGMMTPGEHALDWDGLTDHGTRAAAGVYFIHLTTSEGTRTQRVAMVR